MLLLILMLSTPVLISGTQLFDYSTFGECPRRDLNFTEMVTYDGFSVENYTVTTSDGYKIIIFRIRSDSYDQDLDPIVMCSGLFLSSNFWVVPGANRSHPYHYATLGYDVWLINVQGNYYGRDHVTLNPDTDPTFWAFDYRDMGLKALPACVDYILNVTGKEKVYYIAHSQGMAMALVLLSMEPAYNAKFHLCVGMSTTAYLYNATMPVLELEALTDIPTRILIELGFNIEIFKYRGLAQVTAETLCGYSGLPMPQCYFALYALFGPSNETDPDVICEAVNHEPTGTSLKNWQAWAETKNVGFRRKDYGPIFNHLIYGEETAPEYPLHLITTPLYFITAPDDNVGTVPDHNILMTKLGAGVGHLCVLSKRHFTHTDYIIGRDNLNYCAIPIAGLLATGNLECV